MALNFNNIQIDEELEDLLPRLSEDDSNSLTQSLIENGFDQKFGRIKVWFPEDNDGTGYIIDGHNRYELCNKHNIKYPVEELLLGDNATIIDVMEWMINTQLGRRNLPPAQRLAVMDKFKKKIQEQAKSTQGTRTDLTSSPNGEKVKSTHTDKEIAKMAGVGTGTVARFNKVMNSDDEDGNMEDVKQGEDRLEDNKN